MKKTTSSPAHDRRHFLRLGAGVALAAAAGPALAAPVAASGERRIAFLNLHTGEYLQATYWQDGQYVAEELAAINRVLRDHYNDQVGVMEPQLIESLYRLQQKLGVKRPYQVISGYRSPETNARLRERDRAVAKKSLHMSGQAVDVRLPHGDLERLLLAAREMRSGGVGYYPNSKFVHLDVGRFRTWNG